MTDFHVGQRVVCINDNWRGYRGLDAWPIKGRVYTVREFLDDIPGDEPGLLLQEVVNKPRMHIEGYCEADFRVSHFRPLEEKPDTIEIFRAIANGGDIRPGGDHLDTREFEPIEWPMSGRPILFGGSA